jgi:hypothetical protein
MHLDTDFGQHPPHDAGCAFFFETELGMGMDIAPQRRQHIPLRCVHIPQAHCPLRHFNSAERGLLRNPVPKSEPDALIRSSAAHRSDALAVLQ